MAFPSTGTSRSDTVSLFAAYHWSQAQLARLEGLLGGENGQTSGIRESTNQPNLVVLSTHPQPYPGLFQAPLLASLLALLDAYAPVVGWDPSPEQGTMRVVFDNRQESGRAADVGRVKAVLDGLPLETVGHGADGDKDAMLKVEILDQRVDIAALLPRSLSTSLPRMQVPNGGQSEATNAAPAAVFAPTDHLLPPTTDRNFLISPPGSPPIGWEPIKEDPPNRETLAGDLIDALRRLASARGGDDAETSVEHEEQNNAAAEDFTSSDHDEPQARPGEIRVVLPSQPSDDEDPHSTQLPAVTVQSFVDEVDNNRSHSGTPGQQRPDITQVKATVDSMRGDDANAEADGSHQGQGLAGGGKRITPTGRPPLA